jgi:hypothetical protein
METRYLLYALGFAAIIIVVSVALSLLTAKRRRRHRDDVNGWGRDGANAATWEGIRQAQRIDPGDPG